MGRGLTKILMVFLVALIGFAPQTSWALSKGDKRILKRSAGFGLVLGTAVGVATYPVAKSFMTIVTGAAVGLVTGLIVGAYRLPRDEDVPSADPMALQPRLTPHNLALYQMKAQTVEFSVIHF